MTLPAVDSWQVRGVQGPEYQVGPHCANPNCDRLADDAHHIVRRSKIGGDYRWVEIEGRIVANLCGLCSACHADVTGRPGAGHLAAIRIELEPDLTFWWCLVVKRPEYVEYVQVGELQPQPPTPESLAPSRADGRSEESAACPFCGQAKRRRPHPPGGGRRRKSWTIRVPDDSEDGAEVLDTLVDDLGLVLGIEPNQTGRYFIVLPCVYYAHQERARFVESVKGIGG